MTSAELEYIKHLMDDAVEQHATDYWAHTRTTNRLRLSLDSDITRRIEALEAESQ